MQPRKNPFLAPPEQKMGAYESINIDSVIPAPKHPGKTPASFRELKGIRGNQDRSEDRSSDKVPSSTEEMEVNDMEFPADEACANGEAKIIVRDNTLLKEVSEFEIREPAH